MKVSKKESKTKASWASFGVIFAGFLLQILSYYIGFVMFWVPVATVIGAVYVYYYFNHSYRAGNVSKIVFWVCFLTIFAGAFAIGFVIASEMGISFIDAYIGMLAVLTNKETFPVFVMLFIDGGLSMVAAIVTGIVFNIKFRKKINKAQETQSSENVTKVQDENKETSEVKTEVEEKEEPKLETEQYQEESSVGKDKE